MKYRINTLVATVVSKGNAPKGSVGAIIGNKEGELDVYLVELFTVKNNIHLQLFYSKNEIYSIQQ